ncbi:Prolyl 4-hydroxylase 5 [Colletotrichum tanaceti]|uniref:Prolyl 4-hydroxylase 5 n=1 Tax=Colletotrichum tanaceti TaxID=1306861 RepID=A0A4U6X5W4_9PEZI|nr:Prolyl 4-hydroxylase 5 [Colletotrichum tanaceti]TKW48787.1 Prolyl 4-hydroxylase 5 [Colletotrichum tanaceti]
MSRLRLLTAFSRNSLLVSSFVLLVSIVVLWPRLRPAVPSSDSEQHQHAFSARILSYDPLMIHLENFISKSEREHLLRLGQSSFEASKVTEWDGTNVISEDRTSSTAHLPNGDPIVERIISRASEFQGYTSRGDHEVLQLTRYRAGQKFEPHWDHDQIAPPEDESRQALTEAESRQRLTTIFAVLEASCEECGTRFPSLSVDWEQEDRRWCRFVDCEDKEGITVRAIPGNALFWKNFNSSNGGDERTLHAGLPPETGVKTGLNIWTLM